MICSNPNCRHRSKRKLRPLVITLFPPTTQNNDSLLSPSTNVNDPATVAAAPTTTSNGNNITTKNNNNMSRQEQIAHMFASHPSMAAHFEPPTFSPGVPSRELRNRLKFLEHCNHAGILPEVEWEGICRAVREQQQTPPQSTTLMGVLGLDGLKYDDDKPLENGVDSSAEARDTSKVINPFKYLAVETLIQSNHDDDDDDTNCKNNKNKKKRWLEYETKSLIPISPHRRGSPEDILLPYSMELWRKAKTLNRDRSVLACTLAHLRALKTLVSNRENEKNNSSLNDDSISSCTGNYDFILEDNVRAFVGTVDAGAYPEALDDIPINGASEWSCECANRIWDIIEASNASQSKCHMRYYGWLGSLPNLGWIYETHIPRRTLNDVSKAHVASRDCVLFPYPTNEDFESDSLFVSSKSSKGSNDDQFQSPAKEHSTPQFSTPGGTAAVWGTFAYTVSPAAYHSFLNQLRNDVGSLMWKGKKMRAYKAKPIDKILPRHIKSEYNSSTVHVPSKVAFVRGPMVSLLHPQWDAGFRCSTELQFRLSCGCSEAVWDHVWLAKEERILVGYRENDDHLDQGKLKRLHRKDRSSLTFANIMLLLFVTCSDVFAFRTPVPDELKIWARLKSHVLLGDSLPIERELKLEKLGKVPIISRTIPIEVNLPIDLPQRERSEEFIYSAGNGIHRLNVTIWEMHKPSELIQEWWSIDKPEQEKRVGDPFGVVMWPGSILASKELMKQHLCPQDQSSITNATVLVLGAGTGLEALTAALLGAKRVIATDINSLTLKLLEYGASNDVRIGDNLCGEYFDLFSGKPLPACDILVAADVLYNPELAAQVGLRLHESITRSFNVGITPLKVIITDSQKFHGTNFLEQTELRDLNSLLRESNVEHLEWKSFKLENVCGSGVLVDEDQIYDADVRMISWGW